MTYRSTFLLSAAAFFFSQIQTDPVLAVGEAELERRAEADQLSTAELEQLSPEQLQRLERELCKQKEPTPPHAPKECWAHVSFSKSKLLKPKRHGQEDL